MITKLDPTDFSFVVKRRGSSSRPWRWEIYRAGKSDPLERPAVLFEYQRGKKGAGRFPGQTKRRKCRGPLSGAASPTYARAFERTVMRDPNCGLLWTKADIKSLHGRIDWQRPTPME